MVAVIVVVIINKQPREQRNKLVPRRVCEAEEGPPAERNTGASAYTFTARRPKGRGAPQWAFSRDASPFFAETWLPLVGR